MASGGSGPGSVGGSGVIGQVIHQGGDTYGADIVVGPNDNFDFVIQTGGIDAWEVGSIQQNFYPSTDRGKDVGTKDLRVKSFIGTDYLVLLAQGDTNPVMEMDSSGLHAGPGGVDPVDCRFYRADAGGGNFEWFAETPSGTYQITPGGSSAGAFVQNGNSFGAEAFIGTNDGFSFTLKANGNERIEIKSLGAIWDYTADPGFRGIDNDSQLDPDPSLTGPGFVEGWIGDYNGETRIFVHNSVAGSGSISSFNATNDIPGDGGLTSHYTEFGLPSTGFIDNLAGIHPDEAFWEQSNCALHMVNSNDFPMHFSINTRGAPGPGYPKRVLQLLSDRQIFRGPLITGSVNTDDVPVGLEAFLSIGDVVVKEDVNSELRAFVHNPHNGTGAFASFRARNNSNADMVMGITSNSFTPSGGLQAEEGFLSCTETMNVVTANAGDIKFSPGGTFRAFFGGTNGEFLPVTNGVGAIGVTGIRWADIFGVNAHLSTLLEVKNAVAGDLNLYTWNTSADAAAKSYVRAINDQGADIAMVMTSSGGTHEGTLLYEAGAGATTGIVIDASAGYIKFKSGSALRGYFNSGAGEFLPGGGDGTGSIGASGDAWNDLYIKNAAHVGDLMLDNDEMNSHWTLREAKEKGEDPDTLYAINRRNGSKFRVVLESVAA